MPNPYSIDADTISGMRPLRKVVFAFGSNLGDRLDYLLGGIRTLLTTPDIKIVDVSPIYETTPVDAPDGSGDFLNAVVVAESSLNTDTLLDRALAIEDAYDRERFEEKNVPRTLDVDLIVVGDRNKHEKHLHLPHPRAHQRPFVLIPWLDIDPDAEIPGRGPVSELVKQLDTSGVRRRDDLSLEDLED